MAKVSARNRVLTLEERIVRGAICFDDDPGLTEQSHRDSCDINFILKNYDNTGIAMGNPSIPVYGDFTDVMDYQSALNRVISIQNAFDTLSPKVRKEFDNDPAKFMDALRDPSEASRFTALGFLIEGQGDSGSPDDKSLVGDSKPPEGGQGA